MQAFLDGCAKSVIDGDADAAEKLAREALDKKYPPSRGHREGVREGDQGGGPPLGGGHALSSRARHGRGIDEARDGNPPAGPREKPAGRPKSLGHVVIGTIEGDIHDIGKTLVATMLSANGFEITDLGADVPVAKFVDEAE